MAPDPRPPADTADPGPPPDLAPAGLDPFDLERDGLGRRLDRLVDRADALRDRPGAALALAVALLGLAAGGWWLGRPPAAMPIEAGIPLASPVATTTTTARPTPTTVLVHVTGAVTSPGLVTLDAGSRIADAVTAAGGPTTAAEVERLNLAAPVSDGLQIRVPVRGEAVSAVGTGPNPAGGGDGAPVDINTAGPERLESLPGIGPSLAAAIVEWREANGPFAGPDGLLAVPGIGPAKLAGLLDHLAR